MDIMLHDIADEAQKISYNTEDGEHIVTKKKEISAYDYEDGEQDGEQDGDHIVAKRKEIDSYTYDYDLSKRSHIINEAFKNSLKEAYFHFVINEGRDMLIDSDNNIVTFESKLAIRKFTWNPKTQKLEKVLTGISKSKKRKKKIAEEV